MIAREVSRDPSVLIAAQPTRGLDVGAIEFVHRRLVEQRDAGKAVLLVSLELEEILSLSDRILVLYEGRIVAEFPPDVERGGDRDGDDRRRTQHEARLSESSTDPVRRRAAARAGSGGVRADRRAGGSRSTSAPAAS